MIKIRTTNYIYTLMNEELYIPVDDAIIEFRKHLLTHPRAIYSIYPIIYCQVK